MTLPVVSIVGRPNVGKSSLFNRIVGRKVAVVDDMAGVTRDRNYCESCWNNRPFALVDTGGFVPNTRDALGCDINEQVTLAVEESAVIVFLVDTQTGPTDLDVLIARRLRKEAHERVIVAANKSESRKSIYELGRFMALGFGEPLAISGLHGTGIGNLLDEISSHLKKKRRAAQVPDDDTALRIAILGRPNAGKSSLVNYLLKQKRMIVSPLPGTTRDAVDVRMDYNGSPVVLVDTAGLRKKSRVKLDLEYYSNMRALAAAKNSHVCVLMVDAEQGVGEQDLKIVAQILSLHKGVLVCFNKWDLVKKDTKTFDTLVADIRHRYMQLRHTPVLSISALTGQRVTQVIAAAQDIRRRMAFRVPSGEFKRKTFEWFRQTPHPFVSNTEVRFLGAKQMAVPFPLFRFFVSNHTLVQASYERYLINHIHESWDYCGCPVVVEYRPPARPSRHTASQPYDTDHGEER